MSNLDGQRQLALFSSAEAVPKKTRSKKRLRILHEKDKLNFHFLGDYLTGPSNKEAYYIAKEVITHLGREFPLVLIQAVSGVGKSFLLEIIFNEWKRNYPKKEFGFLTPLDISECNLEEILKYDGIVFDDIGKAAEDLKFREKFSPVIDHFRKENKSLICTTYTPDMEKLRVTDERFYHKISSGLHKTIGKPDALVISKFFERKLGSIFKDNDQLDLLLHKAWFNYCEMLSFIQRVLWYKKFNEKSLLTKEDLQFLLSDGPVLKTGPEFILKKIADRYEVTPNDILSPSRKRQLVKPRYELIHYLHNNMGMSVIEIARFLGRNHSSIIYALKRGL